MKDLLSREIERKYQRTVSVYRGKDDEKPLFSVSTDGSVRFSLRQLLAAAAVAAFAIGALILGAKYDAREAEKKQRQD